MRGMAEIGCANTFPVFAEPTRSSSRPPTGSYAIGGREWERAGTDSEPSGNALVGASSHGFPYLLSQLRHPEGLLDNGELFAFDEFGAPGRQEDLEIRTPGERGMSPGRWIDPSVWRPWTRRAACRFSERGRY